MTKALDENEKLKAGVLPADPAHGTVRVLPKATDAPRILTVRQIIEAAADRAKSTAKADFCTTGHYLLDAATGGIGKSENWVFGGPSSWGKSSWFVSVVDENLKKKKRCLIVSNEDSEAVYGNRLLARRSGVSARRIKSQRIDSFDHERIEKVVREAEALPVFLDARGKSAEWTATQVDKLITSEELDLVGYDYIQEFKADKRQDDRRLTLMHIAATLREPTEKHNRACIQFSQLTFSADTSKRKHPDRDMIRDCRDVANAATVILLGYTPEEAITQPAERDGDEEKVLVPAGSKAIWIDKVKEGPAKFAIGLEWDDDTASFAAVKDPNPLPGDEFASDFQDGERYP